MIRHHNGSRGILSVIRGRHKPVNTAEGIDQDLKRQRAIEQKHAWRSELKKQKVRVEENESQRTEESMDLADICQSGTSGTVCNDEADAGRSSEAED